VTRLILVIGPKNLWRDVTEPSVSASINMEADPSNRPKLSSPHVLLVFVFDPTGADVRITEPISAIPWQIRLGGHLNTMNMEQVQENMRAVKILGPIGESRPVKKNFWSRCAAIDSSTIIRGLPDLHQVQFSCRGFPTFDTSSAVLTEGIYRLSKEERWSALAHPLWHSRLE
jgi:hypothetical protein